MKAPYSRGKPVACNRVERTSVAVRGGLMSTANCAGRPDLVFRLEPRARDTQAESDRYALPRCGSVACGAAPAVKARIRPVGARFCAMCAPARLRLSKKIDSGLAKD